MNLLCDGIVVGFVMEGGVIVLLSRLMEKLSDLGCVTVGFRQWGRVGDVGEDEGRMLGVWMWGRVLGH